MPFRGLLLFLLLNGCHSSGTPCMSMSSPSALVQAAARLRLEVYDGSAHCAGAAIQAGAPPPTQSKEVTAGQPIRLDIPAGRHVLLLTAFADEGATQLLGSACTESNLIADSSTCFDLVLEAVPDGAVFDAAAPTDDGGCEGGVCPCAAQPDSCPTGSYCGTDGKCAAGCKGAADCAGKGSAILCKVAEHRCVECLQPGDCAAGKRCSPSGSCVDGCDVAAGSLCAGTLSCCSSLCIDTKQDLSSCGACGRACASVQVATPSCAGGLCAPTCNAGFGDCNHPIAPATDDGCETNLYDVAHCGACSNACSLPHATPTCPSGTCQIQTCSSGFYDCDAAPANGCECPGVDLLDGKMGCCPNKMCQTAHTDGFTHAFFDCEPTYSKNLALDAAKAYNLAGATIFATSLDTVSVVCAQNPATECVCWAWADTSSVNPATGFANRRVAAGSGNCRVPVNGLNPWN